jgi:hypothetical protein
VGCDIHYVWEVKRDGKWVEAPTQPELDRNYRLFSVLANVRNGYGFAGSDTGDRITPIAMPRGMPGDSTLEANAKEWDCDGHSHSWLTLAEMLAYDWDAPAGNGRGWLSAEQFREWDGKSSPESWSGGVSGPGVTHVGIEYMRKLIAEGRPIAPHTYTQVSWPRTARSAVGGYYDSIMSAKALGNPEDVRLVFFFDN